MKTTQTLLKESLEPQTQLELHPAVANPVVSIIIPTYNCLEFLPIAIRSIQKQQVAELEILILDDGSTDESWQYLNAAAQRDQRIKPIKLAGGGVAKARNHGLRQAKGDYIAFLDADDIWFEGKLAKQLAFHQQQPEVTLTFTNYLHFSDDNPDLGDCFGYWPRFNKVATSSNKAATSTNVPSANISTEQSSPNSQIATGYRSLEGRSASTIFAENVIGTSCVMISRQAIGEMIFFDETLKSAEDWDFWLEAASRGPIGYTSSVDMAYLMRPGSETSRVQLRLQYVQEIMQRHYKPVMKASPAALLHSISRLLTGYGEFHRSENSLLKPCGYHLFAFLLSPSWRLLKAFLADVKQLVTAPFHKLQAGR